jgi:amino acid adenylation domain-containing protein
MDGAGKVMNKIPATKFSHHSMTNGIADKRLLPASPQQEGVWFHALTSGTAYWNFVEIKCFKGVLRTDILLKSLQLIVDRQASLRTSFQLKDDTVWQNIHPHIAIEACFHHQLFNETDQHQRDQLIEAVFQEEVQYEFDLEKDTLFRFKLLESGDLFYLFFTINHIITDVDSMQIFWGELVRYYNQLIQGTEIEVPVLSDTYASYAIAQRAFFETDAYKQQKAWYLKKYSIPIQPLELPFPAYKDRFTLGYHEVALTPALMKDIRVYSLKKRVLFSAVFHLAFGILLHRISGSKHMLVGNAYNGRRFSKGAYRDVIGLFAKILINEYEVREHDTLPVLLARINDNLVTTFANSEVAYEELLRDINSLTKRGFDSFLHASFNIIKTGDSDDSLANMETIVLEDRLVDEKDTNIGLFIIDHPVKPAFRLTLKCAETDLPVINSLAECYLEILQQCIYGDQEQLVTMLPIIPHSQQLLLQRFNNTGNNYTDTGTVVDHFAGQVQQTPDQIAIVQEEEYITYAELDIRSTQLAHYLRKQGIGAEVLVPVCMERSIEMIIAILGIIKSGGAYVPIDPEYPAERMRHILTDTAATMVLTNQSCKNRLPRDAGITVIVLEAYANQLAMEPVEKIEMLPKPGSLMYIIYTSGSTGTPKGVMVTHRTLLMRLVTEMELLSVDHNTVTCLLTNYVFDVSLLEIFLPLIAGSRIVIPTSEQLSHPELLLSLLIDERVNLLQATPGFLSPLIAAVTTVQSNLLSLQQICIGGESLQAGLVEAIQLKLPQVRINNHYGPTETAIDAIVLEDVKDGRQNIIGRPIANTSVHIVDAACLPLPIGVGGELCIGGQGLALGYLNRPELTAEKFIPDPFSSGINDLLYKTGDIARWLPNGTIEYMGRKDEQVKIRGYRIELGEIEAALLQSGMVAQGLVTTCEDGMGNLQLAGYIVCKNDFDKDALKAYLSERLPEYMVPRIWMKIPSIPLNSNGKTDKKKLPAPDIALLRTNEYTGPENGTQLQLLQIWEEMLGINGIGIHDNFFELGGHSLHATRLASFISNKLKTKVSVKDIFLHSTIYQLDRYLQAVVPEDAIPPLVKQAVMDKVPLSFNQERLWFIDRLEGSTHYHIPWILQLKGTLDTEALSYAFNQILQRHTVLRSVIVEEEGVACQQVRQQPGWQIERINNVLYQEDENALRVLINSLLARPFDLTNDCMLRVHLIALSGEEHILLITIHHIAADGWSLGIMVKEITALYAAYTEGRDFQLPLLPVQYEDFSLWQRKYFQTEIIQRQIDYWHQQLSGVKILELPLDAPRPAIPGTKGACMFVQLDPGLSDGLRNLSSRLGASLFMTLLSAFKLLLYRYTGQDDICVGTPIAGRTRQDTEGLIGFFVNMLALRSDLSGNPSFVKLLEQVKTTTLNAYEHQEVPFAKVVESVVNERDINRSPLFQVMFGMEHTNSEQVFRLPGMEVSDYETLLDTQAKFDLTILAQEKQEHIELYVEYRSDLFRASGIDTMVSHFKQLLNEILLSPETGIDDLVMVRPDEERSILETFNNTDVAYDSTGTIVDLFFSQVEKTPGITAVIFEDTALSYRELDIRSNRLAHYLRKQGVREEVLVPVCIDRSIDMILAILGIIKSGGAYVPIDPEYPAERIQYILSDTNSRIVLTSRDCCSKIPEDITKTILVLETHWEAIAREPAAPVITSLRGNNLLYVIYTSGSTGKPKGVMNQHDGVVNRLLWTQQYFNLTVSDRVLQKTTFCFDVSVWELFWPLISGACLVFAIPGGHRNSDYLKEVITEKAITVIHFVPSMLEVFLQETAQDSFPQLKRVLCSGEALKPAQASLFYKKLNHVTLYNLYGPTEAAVDVSCWEVPKEPEYLRSVAIGYPVSNTQIYIVNKNNHLQPTGITGELCIGGIQVARGYLNRENLTKEKFVPDPFSLLPDARMYRTGDMARWLPDGCVEYIGRIDEQVKIRGYRIELGEIERVLQQSNLVQQGVVLAGEDSTGNIRLTGYVVTGDSFNQEAVKDYLGKFLPAYMIPQVWVTVASIPLTVNGKTDKAALKKNEPVHILNHSYELPQNHLEFTLVKIWEQLLGIKGIGVTDNFFTLGGHSILLIQVMYKAKQYGYDLPFRDLFTCQTIRDLSYHLKERNIESAQGIPEQAHPNIKLLCKGDPSKILFLLPGTPGFVEKYFDFADAFAGNFQVYGIQLTGLREGEEPCSGIEEAANAIIEWIKLVQPNGPYRFVGHSFGAYLAYETARQLEAANQEVAFVAILDAGADLKSARYKKNGIVDTEIMELAEYCLQRFDLIHSFASTSWASILKTEISKYAYHEKATAVIRFLGDQIQISKPGLFIWSVLYTEIIHYLTTYEPSATLNAALLIVKAEKQGWTGYDHYLGWKLFSNNPACIQVPGDHETMIFDPAHAYELAQHIIRYSNSSFQYQADELSKDILS